MTRTTLPLLAAVAAIACASGPSAKQRRGAEIHHDLAVEALKGGRAQEALSEYDQALKLDDKLPEAYFGRGLTYEFGFGKVDEAEKDYRRALALKPDYPEAHNNLGQLLAKSGRLDEAVTHFDAALGDVMYREPYVARCNKGLALWRLGKKEEGRAELRSCVALAPRYCVGRREFGNVSLADGRPKEAVEQFTVYADVCKTPDAFLRLAQARMKAGDVAGARTAFEKCVELGTGTPEAAECTRSLGLLR
jgi:type IV pilus assembly protein PilF